MTLIEGVGRRMLIAAVQFDLCASVRQRPFLTCGEKARTDAFAAMLLCHDQRRDPCEGVAVQQRSDVHAKQTNRVTIHLRKEDAVRRRTFKSGQALMDLAVRDGTAQLREKRSNRLCV